MTNTHLTDTTPDTNGASARTGAYDTDRTVRHTTETKSALKTTEFFVYILVVAAIIVVANVIGNGAGGGKDLFNALQATQLIVAVTIAYLLSRGLAKAGSRERYNA
jgi:hypothetical protein